jgi:hypothetical protein
LKAREVAICDMALGADLKSEECGLIHSLPEVI